jgi:hypothetical protein
MNLIWGNQILKTEYFEGEPMLKFLALFIK